METETKAEQNAGGRIQARADLKERRRFDRRNTRGRTGEEQPVRLRNVAAQRIGEESFSICVEKDLPEIIPDRPAPARHLTKSSVSANFSAPSVVE
ncbi:hypothetical protein ELH91_31470 (plasmid) [Rhizobium leguminosarum]|uniref:hypothetical protein n=1 Tax=Rhizobium leguminosarum TaxID=384 RepID=UPI001031BF04|nr:hypothetical protein [Rhizobium leguminosarum]TAY05917.1 hypothetical protein ELH91_31470 [Rhizobium leguminosarum]